MNTTIFEALEPSQIETVRELFVEYQAAVGIDLCFQSFEEELASLPGAYSRPSGRLLIAIADGKVAGCGALKPLELGVCEMKRVFVRPAFRGLGLGRALAVRLIEEARAIGYRVMKLDSLNHMKEAQALYRTLGFREIEAYYDNPHGGVFMELELRSP